MKFKCFSCFLCDKEQSQIQNGKEKKKRDYPWEIYTLKELLRATNNFHQDNKIGEGGFGSVYWGRTSKGVEAITFIFRTLSI
ncbi:hypothetical protein ACSQ67_014031 [Phaseolus vulgaris]